MSTTGAHILSHIALYTWTAGLSVDVVVSVESLGRSSVSRRSWSGP